MNFKKLETRHKISLLWISKNIISRRPIYDLAGSTPISEFFKTCIFFVFAVSFMDVIYE